MRFVIDGLWAANARHVPSRKRQLQQLHANLQQRQTHQHRPRRQRLYRASRRHRVALAHVRRQIWRQNRRQLRQKQRKCVKRRPRHRRRQNGVPILAQFRAKATFRWWKHHMKWVLRCCCLILRCFGRLRWCWFSCLRLWKKSLFGRFRFAGEREKERLFCDLRHKQKRKIYFSLKFCVIASSKTK